VFTGNYPSRRAFEKNGFRLEGTVRRAVQKRGQLLDEWLLGLLPEEWLK
jgi:RimJ/RimL family protein N-acetyltransferase